MMIRPESVTMAIPKDFGTMKKPTDMKKALKRHTKKIKKSEKKCVQSSKSMI